MYKEFKYFKFTFHIQIKDLLIYSGFFALCITLFLMPFPRSWSLYSLCIFLLSGFSIWIINFENVKKDISRKIFIFLPLIAYFILHVIYFIFDSKWSYIEDKLMFLLIPLIGFPIIDSDFFNNHLRYLFLSFLTGIIAICTFQFFRVTIESLSFTGGSIIFEPFISLGISRFNWEQLSSFEHPTYLGMKLLLGISIILFTNKILKIKLIYRSILIISFTIFLLFLSVRIGILILGLLIILRAFSSINKMSLKVLFILTTPLIFISLFSLANLNNRVREKVDELNKKIKVDKIAWQDIDPRTRSWTSAYNLIKGSPVLGVGLDARNILTQEYKKNNYTAEADLRLNAHNQYLETQLTFGIPGTLILFWMLLTLLFRKEKSWCSEVIIPFIIIISVSMIFESILVRQWGIMFFVLFYCILVTQLKENTCLESIPNEIEESLRN